MSCVQLLALIYALVFILAPAAAVQDYRFPGSMGQQYFLGMESIMGGSGDCK
jgi:hypothetical protein